MFLACFLLFFISLCFCITKTKETHNKILISLTYIISLIIITFKEELGGTELPDLLMYKSYFEENIKNIDLRSTFIEPSFYIIAEFTKIIGGDFHLFVLFYGFLSVTIKYQAIIKYSSSIKLSLLTFFSYFFLLQSVIQIRAGVATSIFLISIGYIYEKKIFKYILSCISAIIFHISSLILVPLYFLNPKHLNGKLYKLILLFSLTIPIIGKSLIEIIIPLIPSGIIQTKISGYLTYSNSEEFYYGNYIGVILRLLIAILIINNIEKINSKHKYILVKIYAIAITLFFCLSSLPIVAGRVLEYLQVVEILLIPYLLYCLKNKKIALVLILLYSFFIFYTKTISLLN